MRLEEVLPAYREGKVIESSIDKYRRNYLAYKPLESATEYELLGEWTVEKEPAKLRLMAPALCRAASGRWHVSEEIFENAEEARRYMGAQFHDWPVLDNEGLPVWCSVPGGE